MSTALLVLLGLSLLAMVYPILIYPVLVLLLARLRPRPWRESAVELPVAHLITVHNEQQRIREKLENAMAVQAPPGGLETIVVSDGSDDGTEAIVAEFAERGVRWIGCPRRGKEYAQIDAIAQIDTPILVFSDASSRLHPDAIRQLIAPFADPDVAAVSGTDRLEGEGSTGEDLYVDYEMRVRRAESLVGSLVGLSGCFFAARREICERWRPDVPNDMGSALLAIAAGRRAVAADGALCTYGTTASAGREFRRKRRTALRGLRGLFAYRAAMFRGQPIAAWEVISHKLMRFLAPGFALAALLCIVVGAAAGLPWARIAGALVVAGAVAAALGLAFPALGGWRPLRALSFLTLTMAAVAAAWVSVLRRDKAVLWAPTERP